jgi:hypothetical protein
MCGHLWTCRLDRRELNVEVKLAHPGDHDTWTLHIMAAASHSVFMLTVNPAEAPPVNIHTFGSA